MEKISTKESQRGHPRLRGGQLPLPHTLNARQMKSMAAICETFVPSVRMDEVGVSSDSNPDNSNFATPKSGIDNREASAKGSADDVAEFYRLSASDINVPPRAAGMIFRCFRPDVLRSVGWILWLMDTFPGTLLLFGMMSFSWRYPFFLSFTQFSPERRERALLRWANSRIPSFGQLFKLFRMFSLFSFYSYADESGHNPSWRAIGFSGAEETKTSDDSETSARRPLEGKVLEDNPDTSSAEKLANFLVDGGFSLLDPQNISELRGAARGGSKKELKDKQEVGVKCDALVIGSGSGGGVVAGALAQAGYKVLVLERGAYYARNDYTLLEGPSLGEMYEGNSAICTDDALVAFQTGSTVGGGSAINWAASFRTPDHVRQEWAKVHGLSFFASEEYERAMDKVCERGSVNSSCRKCSFQNQVLNKGCERMGFQLSEVPRNVLDQHDCGWCHLGCKTGRKQATSETWLVDAVEAGGLIVPNCTVQEVLYRESGDGSGKEFSAMGAIASWGGDVTLYVDSKVTVLCGGSMNTPTVMLKSGLRNPSIGRHLRVHPVVMCWGYFPEDGERESYSGTCYEGAIMTAVSSQTANWVSSGYGAVVEVPILSPGTFSAMIPWESGIKHKRRMKKYSRTAHFIVLTRDRGSGRVGLTRDGHRRLTYKLDAQDLENLMAGLQNGLRAMWAAGAEEIGTQHIGGRTFYRRKPSSESSSSSTAEEEAEFEKYLEEVRVTGFEGLKTPVSSAHQMGSCRMGVSRESSVVDPTGESWEVDGLFLGDSSVFPTASGVNPMITVQSVALYIAHKIISKLRNSQEEKS